ncbi:homogentisate 1,2-dioxygenase [Sphingobium boeckii]|uniref:Homogentisate 1,2-dioxygenase n=1 Tax=Sphingobium boeckii TaxID=1082345 RepID=A0A7W9AH64_9SPHN|nr:homogentisate 1,2-dioxygenase [Sphingobium boeckii]MBB5685628.1 hypothetical protein [Sphingobium boeckii]
MRYRWQGLTAGLAMMAAVAPALAAEERAPVACGAMDAALPAELNGWTRVTDGAVVVGQTRALTLSPIAALTFVVAPGRAADAGTFGAVMTFDVATSGHYRVALGQGAWIDLVKDGKALTSTTHSHGPACSTIRKIVDFDLVPGRYVLQLSGAKAAAMPVMVVKA